MTNPILMSDHLYPPAQIVVAGKFRGHRPLKYVKGRFASYGASVYTENGWHRARVTKGGDVIYMGHATRNRDEALALAERMMAGLKTRMAK